MNKLEIQAELNKVNNTLKLLNKNHTGRESLSNIYKQSAEFIIDHNSSLLNESVFRMNDYETDLYNCSVKVEKTYEASKYNNQQYILIKMIISHKPTNTDLKVLNSKVYQHKFLSKVIGLWDNRVNKTEKNMIKKASEIAYLG